MIRKDTIMKKQKASQPPHLIGLLGSKWGLLITHTLGTNTLRFTELQKALPQPTQKVPSTTLRKLERSGIVDRRIYPTVPPQVEYKLTSIGLDLLKLSGVLSDWVNIHEEEIKRAQKSYDHRNKS